MDVDLDDLFDTEPAEDATAGQRAEPLFADESDDANANADGENPDDGQQKTDDPNAAGDPKPKKKQVRRPQVVLNADRLCGPRGIGIMEEAFSDVVFAGKGHEHADLGLLMAKMQHWAHRMYPKMPFDQAVEKMEKLGKDVKVKVNVRKIRRGMNVLPTVVPEEPDETQRGEPERDVFDELIGGAPLSPPPPAERPATPPQTNTSTLTEEQRERMRKNREAAQLRRMRAQFTRQEEPSGAEEPEPSGAEEQQQQQPTESEQETQFPGGADSSPAAVAAATAGSSASQPRSPGGQRLSDAAETAGSVSRSQPAAAAGAGGGDGPGPVSSAVEVEDGQDTEASRADADMAPAVTLDQQTDSNPATEHQDTEMMVIEEDEQTSASRLGHLHQMSETAPIQVDSEETEPIVIPDDEETATVTAGPRDQETEAIVIPDDQDTDAIMVPDDEETDAL